MSWLETDDRDEVRWLTLTRPEVKNAVPPEGWRDLEEAFAEFAKSSARVLVLTGAGGDFCAGADLGDDPRRPRTAEERHGLMKAVGSAAMALHRAPKPTIAAVDGVAVGAGMNLALGCDVVLATPRARFSEIFVRRGLTVDFGGTWLLPRIVGLQRAKELALSGRIVGAEEALRIGLVLDVVGEGGLEARAGEQARSFLQGAPVAQALAKTALSASFELSFSEAVAWEGQSQTIAGGTEDAAEGISAFVERREPGWRGR